MNKPLQEAGLQGDGKGHDNFHAAKFATEVTAAFYESLRGRASIHGLDHEKVCECIRKLCSDMEKLADDSSDKI
jgi:hypothetical protein